ncbi:MAG: hypothetical protein DCC60_00005 [Ignavibacteriae bacterium]|nr:MAG: hypothetical protein DCC60_00005 [Ignavibacteriota bacterium]
MKKHLSLCQGEFSNDNFHREVVKFEIYCFIKYHFAQKSCYFVIPKFSDEKLRVVIADLMRKE